MIKIRAQKTHCGGGGFVYVEGKLYFIVSVG